MPQAALGVLQLTAATIYFYFMPIVKAFALFCVILFHFASTFRVFISLLSFMGKKKERLLCISQFILVFSPDLSKSDLWLGTVAAFTVSCFSWKPEEHNWQNIINFVSAMWSLFSFEQQMRLRHVCTHTHKINMLWFLKDHADGSLLEHTSIIRIPKCNHCCAFVKDYREGKKMDTLQWKLFLINVLELLVASTYETHFRLYLKC